jgi:hypothetical protein
MAKKSDTKTAAWIGFYGVILAAIIAVLTQHFLANPKNKGQVNIDISLHEQNMISDSDSLDSQSEKQLPLIPKDKQTILSYTYDRPGKEIRIKPQMEYLNILNKDTIINGMNLKLQCSYPVLSIKMVNNTNETVYFNEVIVNIISSGIVKEPIPWIRNYTRNKLVITNEGWGKLLEPIIHFSITDSNAYDHISTINLPLKYSIILEDFNSSMEVDLDKFSPSPTETYSTIDRPLPLYASYSQDLILTKGTVCVFGILEYKNENYEPRTFKFKTLVDLTYFLEWPKYLSHIGVSQIYGLNLEAGESGFEKHIPISQALKNGEVDQFLLRLASNKSAKYHLNFKFITLNSIDIKGTDIYIEFFVPRSNSEFIEDIKKLEKFKN